MSVTVTTQDTINLIELSGDVDGKTAPLIQKEILPLATEDCKLLLDMSQISYMSSAGLRMLLSIRRQVPPGGRILLVALPEPIRETMSITGFLDFFTITPTREEAVAALNN